MKSSVFYTWYLAIAFATFALFACHPVQAQEENTGSPQAIEAGQVAMMYLTRIHDGDLAGAVRLHSASMLGVIPAPEALAKVVAGGATMMQAYKTAEVWTNYSDGPNGEIVVLVLHMSADKNFAIAFKMVKEDGIFRIDGVLIHPLGPSV